MGSERTGIIPPPSRNSKGAPMANPIVSRYRAWRRYRETYNELMRLSNRDLADLGAIDAADTEER